MRRILYFDIAGQGGGSNHSLRTLLDHLPRDRYEPIVVTGTPPAARLWQGHAVTHLPQAGFDNTDFFPAAWSVRWIYHLLRWLLRLPGDYLRARRLLGRLRPDLVHINTGQSLAFGLAAHALRLPIIWHIRELVAPNAWGRLQERIYRRCAARVVANSQAVARRLPRCADRLVVVPNPVDPQPAAASAVEAFRAQFGLAGRFVVLLLGSPSRAKGAFFLADVADAADDGRMCFVIAGEDADAPAGPLHRAFRRLYRTVHPPEHAALRARWAGLVSHGRAVFTGHVPAATACAACDVLVCPNLVGESFGRTVIEAYAAGKPVLAADRPPFDETVSSGRTGWRLPLHADAWAGRLRQLADEPETARALGAAGRATVSRFAPARHVEALGALYHEVAP